MTSMRPVDSCDLPVTKKNTLKIAFMARSLGLQHGGVYRYVYNVLKEFDRRAEEEGLDIYILHNEKTIQGKFPHCREIYLQGAHSYSHRLLFDYIYSLWYLIRLQVDVIIYPKNIIPFTHSILRANKVNTVLDLGHFDKELHAYRFWDTLYAKAFMKFSCDVSSQTLAISHYTKKDLIQKLRIPSEKIKVVHLGIEEKFQKTRASDSIIEKFHVRVPFLFYNGSLSPRKNMMRVLQAFQQIKDLIPHTLYITGSLTWGAEQIYEYIKEHLGERVRIVGYLEEHELIAFYSLAELFLYPSLFEGFGLPILEAQACGCPVLTSNVTACPEVAGKGAHFVNPYSVEEIKAGILKVVHDKNYQQMLIKHGLKNLRQFSWKKTAEGILGVLEKIEIPLEE